MVVWPVSSPPRNWACPTWFVLSYYTLILFEFLSVSNVDQLLLKFPGAANTHDVWDQHKTVFSVRSKCKPENIYSAKPLLL